MFGFGQKKEAQQRLAALMQRAEAALSSQSVEVVRETHDTLRSAWVEIDTDNLEALGLLNRLEQRLEDLTRIALERLARPCVRCASPEHAVSLPFRINELDVPGAWEKSPHLRMWVCRACGTVELVADNLSEIKEPLFPTIVRVPDPQRGPFR